MKPSNDRVVEYAHDALYKLNKSFNALTAAINDASATMEIVQDHLECEGVLDKVESMHYKAQRDLMDLSTEMERL